MLKPLMHPKALLTIVTFWGTLVQLWRSSISSTTISGKRQAWNFEMQSLLARKVSQPNLPRESPREAARERSTSPFSYHRLFRNQRILNRRWLGRFINNHQLSRGWQVPNDNEWVICVHSPSIIIFLNFHQCHWHRWWCVHMSDSGYMQTVSKKKKGTPVPSSNRQKKDEEKQNS